MHICHEEIAMIVGVLAGSSGAACWVRSKWHTVRRLFGRKECVHPKDIKLSTQTEQREVD